jgi:hypothetical protein
MTTTILIHQKLNFLKLNFRNIKTNKHDRNNKQWRKPQYPNGWYS